MGKKLEVSIIGGGGYVGGELIRLLLFHPNVSITQVIDEKLKGKYIHRVHPNLQGLADLKFVSMGNIKKVDCCFVCLSHGGLTKKFDIVKEHADKIIDLSSDFRLNDEDEYLKWNKLDHKRPELLKEFVYGLPELHREEIKEAELVTIPGCNAVVTLLGVYPLFKSGIVDTRKISTDIKVGTSQAVGVNIPDGMYQINKSWDINTFKPAGHKHTGEVIQELEQFGDVEVEMCVSSLKMARGALATTSVFINRPFTEMDIWKLYRKECNNEPFLRIVKETKGLHRYPEPRVVTGTNFCDIGFARDPYTNRLVVISAIDNLMKGAAGLAVQCFNLMYGNKESVGLKFPGLHPL